MSLRRPLLRPEADASSGEKLGVIDDGGRRVHALWPRRRGEVWHESMHGQLRDIPIMRIRRGSPISFTFGHVARQVLAPKACRLTAPRLEQ
jgi:hypothetical protein